MVLNQLPFQPLRRIIFFLIQIFVHGIEQWCVVEIHGRFIDWIVVGHQNSLSGYEAGEVLQSASKWIIRYVGSLVETLAMLQSYSKVTNNPNYRIFMQPLSYDYLDYAASFNTKDFIGGIVGISGSTLRIIAPERVFIHIL